MYVKIIFVTTNTKKKALFINKDRSVTILEWKPPKLIVAVQTHEEEPATIDGSPPIVHGAHEYLIILLYLLLLCCIVLTMILLLQWATQCNKQWMI